MIELARPPERPAAAGRRRLAVAIAAADPVRAADLAARVALAGHAVVEDAAEADVILADASSPVSPAQPALRLGAGAPLPGDLGPALLDAALRATALGLSVSLPAPRPGFAPAEPKPLLTPRELEILACLAEGLSNKLAARRLGISAHTVKFHLEAVFAKLGAATRTEAVARGLRAGLIEL